MADLRLDRTRCSSRLGSIERTVPAPLETKG